MKTVDARSLGLRLIELLRLGSEATVELQVLRDGSLRVMKGGESD